VWSSIAVGDLRPTIDPTDGPGPLAQWAGRVTGSGHRPGPVRRVHWLDQVHGVEVVTVDPPPLGIGTGPGPGRWAEVCAGPGDSLVSADRSNALAVLTADCASVALGSEEGVFGAVHAGWRGLTGGVVEATVETMRSMGAGEVVGALGPCIHPECYEFSPDDLNTVAAAYGDDVRGHTAAGGPALDIPAAVSLALAAGGAREAPGVDACTGCAGGYFSHRARGEIGRQALIVWSDEGSDDG
jgi:polyphenol oxidase